VDAKCGKKKYRNHRKKGRFVAVLPVKKVYFVKSDNLTRASNSTSMYVFLPFSRKLRPCPVLRHRHMVIHPPSLERIYT
jgi:hypothetical protein